jgi:hypothetical protein
LVQLFIMLSYSLLVLMSAPLYIPYNKLFKSLTSSSGPNFYFSLRQGLSCVPGCPWTPDPPASDSCVVHYHTGLFFSKWPDHCSLEIITFVCIMMTHIDPWICCHMVINIPISNDPTSIFHIYVTDCLLEMHI